MRIRFTETVSTREAIPRRFTRGQVIDLAPRSAGHWIARGKAVSAPLPAPPPDGVDSGAQLTPAAGDQATPGGSADGMAAAPAAGAADGQGGTPGAEGEQGGVAAVPGAAGDPAAAEAAKAKRAK